MDKLFANSEDPDQTPRSAASDLGLHCLPITLLGFSRLQWVNGSDSFILDMEICFRHGDFEPLRVNNSTTSRSKGNTLRTPFRSSIK